MAKISKLDIKKIRQTFGKAAGDVITWTIADVQKTAQRSMRKPGKKAKKNAHSQPGKPPFQHTGALRGSVRYDVNTRERAAVAGPEKWEGQSQGAKALEFGGSVRKRVIRRKGKVKSVEYTLSKRKTKQRIKHKVGSRQRPEGRARKYKVRNGVRFGKTRTYTYFYSEQAWEAARNSPNFQRWAQGEPQEYEMTEITIEARPFMRPALEKELQKLPNRWNRAKKRMMP